MLLSIASFCVMSYLALVAFTGFCAGTNDPTTSWSEIMLMLTAALFFIVLAAANLAEVFL